MVNVARAAGIEETTVAYHVSVADYDRDGWEDFLFNRKWKAPMKLYRNVGGRFAEDRRTDFGIMDRLDCEWGDPNVDGRPDFYCSVGAKHGTAVKANQLWIQQPDGTFRNEAAAWRVTDPYGRGRQVAWFNFNGDSYPDLFLGNDYPRVDDIPSPNRVFVNQGGTQFREVVISGVTGEIGARCAFPADLDRNGYDDLVVCGNTGLHVYRNTGGTGFQDMAPALGLANKHGAGLAADLNGDSKLELVLVSGGKVRMYEFIGPWTLGPPQVIRWSMAKEVAAADVDGDNDLDVYVTRAGVPNPSDLLLRNRGNGIVDVQVVGASTSEGFGGRCVAIDHDKDGRDGVLVVNSFDGKGPGPLELMVQR